MSEHRELPRCGDHVLHRPTGETWVVAYATTDHLVPAGWPPCMAQTPDCEVIRPASDAQHAAAVREWMASGDRSYWVRARVIDLYACPDA